MINMLHSLKIRQDNNNHEAHISDKYFTNLHILGWSLFSMMTQHTYAKLILDTLYERDRTCIHI